MNLYNILSFGYDLLDKWWFSDKGENPRNVINSLVPNKEVSVLDMCCGTFSNGLPIAKKNPKNTVIGVDRSESMLREARKKISLEGAGNATLICTDATNTGLKDKSFDYITLGLVLHECNEELWNNLLKEAYRLLKDDGRLIVLEWEKQTKLSRKLKYLPLYVAEVLVNPKFFKLFYNSDKDDFFRKYNFTIEKKHDCNYSSVMVMTKQEIS